MVVKYGQWTDMMQNADIQGVTDIQDVVLLTNYKYQLDRKIYKWTGSGNFWQGIKNNLKYSNSLVTLLKCEKYCRVHAGERGKGRPRALFIK